MIEEIKRIFEDIAKAIIEMGGTIDECTSPEDYAEAIKNLSGNNAVLFVPVFRSSDIKPDTPTTPLDISNPGPDAYPDGWSTPNGLEGNIWMSYTIVSASQIYVPWTEPILIKTANDEVPSTYDDATTRTFLIYLELPDADLTPSVPIGGTWNVTENRLVGTITSELYKDDAYIGRTIDTWSTDNNHVKGCYTWMSMGTFLAETGELIGPWSDPICINLVRDGKDGKDGINGIDGQSIEFIYKLCANEDTARLEPTPESDPDTDDSVPDGWTDHPSGIDPINYRVEIMCTRKKGKDGKWEDFIGPTIWAIWGEDGTDGDGIEYIFRVASQQEVIDNGDGTYQLKPEFWPPTCAGTIDDGCANGYISTVRRDSESTLTDEELLELYQQNEFVPGHLEGHPDAASIGWDRNWTDDPLDVSPSQPFEFCSIRKYDGDFSNIDGTKGTWRWFSEPVLWNKFWSGYAPVFTSFAFTRSRLKLGSMQLEGGDVSNPLPDPQTITQTIDGTQITETINWFDTVPGPSDFPNDETMGHAPVWMTTRQFGSMDPDAEEQDQSWESPRLMADSRFHNTEYSVSDVVTLSTRLPRFDERINDDYPFIDDDDPEGVNEAAWRNYCQTNGLGIWGDENDVSHPKWMATCSFISGKWTEWSLTQCKGEKGEDGPKGRGITSTGTWYMWSADGTNHPAESDSGWSTSVPTFSANTPYLWCKIVITYDSGNPDITYSVSRQGSDGNQGASGAKMRMRNWATDYGSPDSEGQSAWLPGNKREGENADPYYDIAIWPVQAQSISIESGSQNADRLYLCIKKLPYTEVASLVSQYGADNVHPGTGGHLTEYFSKAEGWDFIATKVLLADKITANDIDTAQLSVSELHTKGADGTLDIANNVINLKDSDGQSRCKVSGSNITVPDNISGATQVVVETSPGSKFIGGALENGSYHGVYTLGKVHIGQMNGSIGDEIYSSAKQYLQVEFEGVASETISDINLVCDVDIDIYARDDSTGYSVGSWYYRTGDDDLGTIQTSAGPFRQVSVVPMEADTTSGNPTNIHNNIFSPGDYTLYVDVILRPYVSGGFDLPSTISSPKVYLSWVTFSKFINTHAIALTPVEFSELGSDGFIHAVDQNNYLMAWNDPNNGFRVEMMAGNSNSRFGLRVTSSGIEKWNGSSWVTATL